MLNTTKEVGKSVGTFPATVRRTCPLLVGRCYEFLYPARNVTGCASNLESRLLLVTSVRDLQSSPLDPLTLELSPNLNRDRFLITGTDPERGERSYYFRSMQNVRRIDRDQFDSRRPEFVVADRNRILGRFRSSRRAAWFLKNWNSPTATIFRVLPKK